MGNEKACKVIISRQIYNSGYARAHRWLGEYLQERRGGEAGLTLE
jgi:hypothetical protein